MSVGKTVRKVLGRWEPTIVRRYRSMFIDLDAVAARVAEVAPEARTILEIGCGDGAMAAALCRALPNCRVLGIDPGVPAPGKLYDGDPARAEFRSLTTDQLIAEGTSPFDVVVLCDVLHHVADDARLSVLTDAAKLTVPGGTVAFKDWERRRSVAHFATYASDRWVSNDKGVRFMDREEMDTLLREAMPGWRVTCSTQIPPRRENVLLTLQAP